MDLILKQFIPRCEEMIRQIRTISSPNERRKLLQDAISNWSDGIIRVIYADEVV